MIKQPNDKENDGEIDESKDSPEERLKQLNLSPERIDFLKKEFQSLHITNDFMFGELISSPDLAKLLLETIFSNKLDKVEVRIQETLEPLYKHKEVRLDAYIKGSDQVYNVEMQVKNRGNLLKRCRSYQGKIDLDNEKKGAAYDQLPDTYVIFICMEDPIKGQLSRYDVKNTIQQNPNLSYEDGRHIIYLCPNQWKKEENLELQQFLRYVAEKTVEGNLATKLQEKMNHVKSNINLGVTFMTFQALIYDERQEAREEGIEVGREEGREEGRVEGREEGIEVGRVEGIEVGRIENAILMLPDMSDQQIAKYTGLPLEQIRKLRESHST